MSVENIETLFNSCLPGILESKVLVWVSIPEDSPDSKELIKERHKPWEYMYKGRLQNQLYNHRIKHNITTEANSMIRRLKTIPYERPGPHEKKAYYNLVNYYT